MYQSDRYLDKFSKDLKNFSQDLKRKNFPFEIIIIANEPTIREKRLEKEFSGQAWFSFVSVPRESVFASFNRGMNLAKGEILGYWNADDVRYPKAVVEGKRLMEQGAELVYFPFVIKRYLNIGRWSLPLLWKKVDDQIPEFNHQTRTAFSCGMLCGPFFMFTKALYEKVGPFDEQFKIVGDFDWCARAAKISDKFVKAKSLGGVFRVDGGGLSAGVNQRRIAENNIVYVRNHAWHKLALANDLIIKEYRVHHLLAKGQFHKI